MPSLTIGTKSEDLRLFFMAIIMFGFSLLYLTPISFGILGSPWPIAPIWAIASWGRAAPKLRYAIILFVVGLLFDVISATNFGLYAFINLFCLGGYLLQLRFFDFAPRGTWLEAANVGLIYIFACILSGIIVGNWANILALLLSLILTIFLHPFFIGVFKIEEVRQ